MKTNKMSFATARLFIAVLALFGILGIQYVAAQTATSSEASSTPTDSGAASTTAPDAGSAPTTTPATATTTTTGAVEGAATTTVATTTVAATTTPSSAPVSTSTPPASTEAQPSAPAESTATSATTSSITVATRDSIAGLEETYRRQTGKYLQIQPGNVLPPYESGTVSEKLGNTIPDNARVDIYEAPGGTGYQISYEDNGALYSFGYGPEAADRTFTVKPSAIVSATSTPQ